MPLEIQAELENGPEIERVLVEIAKEYGARNALLPLRQTIRVAMKPLVPQLQAASPVQTGALRNSVRLGVYSNRKGKPTAFGLVGWRTRRGHPQPRTGQFLGLEYGNEKIENPRQILERLFDRNAQRMLNDFIKELPKRMDANLRRIVRKYGKGKLRVTR